MTYLLKLQIGPVQDFIAQARSTRDLWSGSYLLSWLVATGIKALPADSKLIFPSRTGPGGEQPLLKAKLVPGDTGILIPNLPNIFIAEIQGEAKNAADLVRYEIHREWLAIAESVWAIHSKLGISSNLKRRFDAQIARHLSIAWQITPVSDSKDAYRAAYQHNGWHLDAVRQTRYFTAWDSCSSLGNHEKDSLSGREEAIFHGSGKPDISNVWHNLLNKHSDHLGAVALVKRVWHLTFLEAKHKLPTSSDDFLIRSIPAIAGRTKEHDDNATAQEKSAGEKYIAAIAFDGDSVGAWVNGDKSPEEMDLRKHHADFSMALSEFALSHVPGIVAPAEEWLGQLIYAGGDDVVCLVPADAAIHVAEKLRNAFRNATDATESCGEKPDASAGIAIAHIHSPLQDLIREAQKAEKRAKNDVGRPAFSITLMKRSGEISHWGSKWDALGKAPSEKPCGQALYDEIVRSMDAGLSGKFPHRVCELLETYLTTRTGLSKQQDAIADRETAKEIIIREFSHAAERQGSAALAKTLNPLVGFYLDGILKARDEREKSGKTSHLSAFQELLTSVIGLCTTVAFAERNRAITATSTASKQTPALA